MTQHNPSNTRSGLVGFLVTCDQRERGGHHLIAFTSNLHDARLLRDGWAVYDEEYGQKCAIYLVPPEIASYPDNRLTDQERALMNST